MFTINNNRTIQFNEYLFSIDVGTSLRRYAPRAKAAIWWWRSCSG